MATSSITKNFVVSGREQVELFVNAIEKACDESTATTTQDVSITRLSGSEAVKRFMAKRKNAEA